jgi:hypothetical protein
MIGLKSQAKVLTARQTFKDVFDKIVDPDASRLHLVEIACTVYQL